MTNNIEPFKWLKLLLPVILPMLAGGCVILGRVAWTQSSEIQDLKARADSKSAIIRKFEDKFDKTYEDLMMLKIDITTLKSHDKNVDNTQAGILNGLSELTEVISDLKIEIAKLQTRSEYTEKEHN